MITILLDAGHGGVDSGAVYKNYIEKNFNLKITLTLKKYIEDNFKDIIVYLTRSGDNELSLSARYGLSNQLRPSIFISIHCNAGGGTGFESYLRENPSKVETFYRNVIHDNIVTYNNKFKITNRGKKIKNMDVTYYNLYPAMLLEVLFIDNPNDIKFLLDDNYIKGWCEAVANGLASIFNLSKKSTALEIPTTPEITPPVTSPAPTETEPVITKELINVKNKIDEVKNNLTKSIDEIINIINNILNTL